jgi:hypothetical protein
MKTRTLISILITILSVQIPLSGCATQSKSLPANRLLKSRADLKKYDFKIEIDCKRSYQISIFDWKDELDSAKITSYRGNSSFDFKSKSGRCIVIIYDEYQKDQDGHLLYHDNGDLISTGKIMVYIVALLEDGTRVVSSVYCVVTGLGTVFICIS